MKRPRSPIVIGVCAAAIAGCADRPLEPLQEEAASAEWVGGQAAARSGHPAQDYIHEVNARLAEQGIGIALARAEWLLASGAGRVDRVTTVFANDRQLRLDSRWVPDDARRAADGDNLTHAIFAPLALANGTIDASDAIDASFDTWGALPCMKADLVKRELLPGVFPSAILSFVGFTSNPFAADISTIGFLPGFLFDVVLGPGAADNVLGVTFTFIFIAGPGGPPTDIDGNGLDDTALKEVWYNDDFLWSTGGSPGIDIESVALHENGHALELGHFGRIAVTNGRLVVSPRAVMNAIMLGTQRSLLGTDKGALCGQFGSWP